MNLELKIKALVEGLDNVKRLTAELGNAGTAADKAGIDASHGAAGFDGLTTKTGAATSSASGLGKTLEGVTEKAGGAAGSSGALGKALGAIVPEAAVVTTGIDFLTSNVGKLIGAFTALAVAYGLKESADYAARTETLGITMNVVAKNAGYGAEEISKYEKEVKGLGITTQGTREAITQMIQAGLEIGPKAEGQVSQVAKLARAAQDLAVVTGENSSVTLTKLITNIAQLDTVGLRYMGLTVNVEAAEQQFALSIGKTVDQLTQKQKAQVVMNESLKQAEKLNGAYEASMDSVGKKVQSLKRYQEELANDIGSKLLPAYGALVDAATNFLKEADKTAQGIDRSGSSSRLFAEGVSAFGAAMGHALNTVLGMLGEVYPSVAALGKGFLELMGFVINVASEILTLGHYTDAAGNKFTGLGQVIKLVLGTISLVLAGLKDGIDIVTATLYGMGGAALDIIGKMIAGFGKLVSYVNKDWGRAIQGVGEGLQDAGKGMMGFANQTVDQFGRGESAVKKFQKSLHDAAYYTEKLKEVTNFTKAEAEVLKLAEAVRKNGTYTKDFAAQSDALNGKLKDMQSAGGLTADQLGKLQKVLQRLGGDDAANFSKAIDAMGLKLVELGGKDRLAPLNKDFAKAQSSVVELGSSTKTTAAVMNDAFAKGVDSAKTLADLNQMGRSLGDVKKVTGDLTPALTEAGLKFDELFEKALKSAKTQTDFADLRAEVERLGKDGTIAGDAVVRALNEIEEKSTGAEAAMSRLAKRVAEIARAEADVANAHLGMIRAQVDLGRASLDVMLKQNEYSRTNSQLAKEELSLAKLNKQIAYEKSTEAKLAYELAIASSKLLITLQQKLNAEKEVELHIGQRDLEEYKNKAKALSDAAKLAEDNVNWARKEALEQQSIIIKLEEKKLQQELVRDTVKETGVQYSLNKAAVEDVTTETGHLVISQDTVTGKVTETRQAMTGLAGDVGKVNGAIDVMAGKLDKAASAGKSMNVSAPSGSSKSGSSKDNFKDPRLDGRTAAEKNSDIVVMKDQSADSHLITGGNGEKLRKTSNPDSFVNSNGDIVNAQGAITGKSSNGSSGGGDDGAILDLEYDWTHGKKPPRDDATKTMVRTMWSSAQANKEIMDRSPAGAFSLDGYRSRIARYNVARSLMEYLGLSTGGDVAGLNDGSGGTGGFSDGGTGGFAKINGSHKTGLDRVPQDGYIAELHKDEKVLTAEEANQYRNAPSVSDLSHHLLEQISVASKFSAPVMAAQSIQSGSASSTPSKVIQVNLGDGQGRQVPMSINADNEQALLSLLQQFKNRS